MPWDGSNRPLTPEQAFALALRRHLIAFTARAGYAKPGSIPADMTFLAWCLDLQAKGLKVDNKPFDLSDRPALVPLYEAIPTTYEEAQRFTLVVRKGAQLGLTVWEMLADIYMAIKFEPVVIGMFMPQVAMAVDKSKRRFMSVIESVPEAYQKLTTKILPDGSIRRIGSGNVLAREFGTSAFLFLWTSGRGSTESRPMDIISYDEVQEMELAQIDKTDERMSGSKLRFKLMLSTANVEDMDIDNWYRRGTQEAFHTRCSECHALNDLSARFMGDNGVKVIQYNRGHLKRIRCDGVEHVPPPEEYCYVCPDCGSYLHDTQVGQYLAARPERFAERIRSLHISQITSPTITARDMWTSWNNAVTGDQRKTFYNRKLGLPYIDADQMPVTMEHCLASARAGVALGLKWEQRGDGCVMGIDQMGGFNAVIIKRRLRDGRQGVIHCEAIFEEKPFDRCTELMKHFGVTHCVVEQLPNVNDARAFANMEQHRGRVWLANYSGEPKADMITWNDLTISKSDRKTARADRSRYTVTLQQYKAMENSLYRIRNLNCLFPDPGGLEQEVIEKGERKRIVLVRDWVFLHFTKTALVVEGIEPKDPERKPRPKVVKLGLDPHFSFANMLCDVAWARVHGANMIMMPDADGASGPGEPATTEAVQAKVRQSMPGLPASVVNMIQAAPDTCGACANFEHGQCSARGFMTGANEPACILYLPRDE